MTIQGIEIDIQNVATLGGTPAKIRIVEPYKKAIVFIAADKMDGFPTPTKKFILFHEIGHAVLNSGDEIAVDRWAYKQFIKSGGKPKEAVFALSYVLDPIDNSDHDERVRRQFFRAKHTTFLRGRMSAKKFIYTKI